MARKLVIFLVVMVAVWEASNGALCNLSVLDLYNCKPAVSATNPQSPSSGCCEAIKGLTPDDFQCLCNYKNNNPGELEEYGVDPDLATKLPAECGLPPINC